MAIGAARQAAVAGHRHSCSWSQEAGFGAPGLGTKPHHTSKEMCWRRKAGCGGTPWTGTSTTAARKKSRFRTSELLASQTEQGSVSTLCSLCLRFRSSSFAPKDALDGLGRDGGRDWQSVCRAGRRPRWDTSCFQFPACVSALVCLCVCVFVCAPRVQLCVVSSAGPGLFRAQWRSGQIAELWNRIKLHCETFHTLTWEVIRVDQAPPKLRAKGAETRHLVPGGYELAMDFHKHQQSAHSLTHRGLFEQPFGLYMTMALEPFDSVACSRQFCNLHKDCPRMPPTTTCGS